MSRKNWGVSKNEKQRVQRVKFRTYAIISQGGVDFFSLYSFSSWGRFSRSFLPMRFRGGDFSVVRFDQDLYITRATFWKIHAFAFGFRRFRIIIPLRIIQLENTFFCIPSHLTKLLRKYGVCGYNLSWKWLWWASKFFVCTSVFCEKCMMFLRYNDMRQVL